MSLKKTLIYLKSKNAVFPVGMIIVAGILGLYLFINIDDSETISDNPGNVLFSNTTSKEAAVSIKSNHPAITDSEKPAISDETLNIEPKELTDIKEIPEEGLPELYNTSKTDVSSGLNEGMNFNELFKDSVINNHTLSVVSMIQDKFTNSFDADSDGLWSHYNQVEEFLQTQLDDQTKVDEFLDFYKKYTEYELAQVNDPDSFWMETPENPEDAIRLNDEKQRYQREIFGREVADTIWGDEMKMHEYKMKELEILRSDTYSAQVKEQLIKDLRAKTFEDGNGQQATDYNYQLYLKLAIYSDELAHMTENERIEKIKEFREAIFPPDKLKFMEFLEGVVETDSEETNTIDPEAL